jgi:hypothetical protein
MAPSYASMTSHGMVPQCQDEQGKCPDSGMYHRPAIVLRNHLSGLPTGYVFASMVSTVPMVCLSSLRRRFVGYFFCWAIRETERVGITFLMFVKD